MIRQSLQLTIVSLKSLPARWSASLVVVASLAGLVGVMVSVLAMAQGFQKIFNDTGRPDRAVVLRNGTLSEAESTITREEAVTLLDIPGVARDADGHLAASLELQLSSSLSKKSSGEEGALTLRGVTRQAFTVRPEVNIIEGRVFKPGLREVIIGRSAQRVFAGLEVGKQISLSNVNWTVVGVFESAGDVHESEIWADLDTLFTAYNRRDYSSITARLTSESAFPAYKDAITSNPSIEHTALRENEYYAAQTQMITAAIKLLGYAIAIIMAVGALFSAVNTLYAAVRTRSMEIATLRALGFGATPIVFSVLTEALALTLLGGVIGGAISYCLFNGYTATTVGGDYSLSQVQFEFQVSGALMLQGLAWAAVIGFVGGLAPALRAARVPVVEALRAG